ncbi:hypothetical protein GW756_02810 [bacterium]|nr:hypothetical protein [bacterium]NCS67563.1 hypothetical protein [Candidatus Peregrinibacteria bacterium]NCS96272.1 hypothetical protein [bacterium]
MTIACLSVGPPSAGAEELNWQQQLKTLESQFANECQSQQITGEVNLDRNINLATINNQIEAVLKAAGVEVVRINNGQRFYVTDQVYKTGADVDLVINDKVAKRFPSCSRSHKFVSN